MGKLVMVIDDSSTVRKIIETCLGRKGFEVQGFSDGVEAIRWLTKPEAQVPDVVILDVSLPKMDGYEVARRLKSKPQFSNTVIVMLSRHDGMIDKLKGRLVGAKDYLTKPFKTQDIIAVIEAHLGVQQYATSSMNDHSHMSNIDSYAQIQMLEQLSDHEFWEYARSLTVQRRDTPLIASKDYLECYTGQSRYLLPLQALREVVSPPHRLTSLPLSPPWMLGIAAWRGHVLPVVDLNSYFIVDDPNELDVTSTNQQVYSHASSMLVILDDADTLLGMRVAVVESITTLEQTQLASPEQAPAWYPLRLLTMLLGVYNGSVVLNTQVLIAEMMQQIKVNAAYE